MATQQGDESLKHPSVVKFGTTNGAKKDAEPTDYSAGRGTTAPDKKPGR